MKCKLRYPEFNLEVVKMVPNYWNFLDKYSQKYPFLLSWSFETWLIYIVIWHLPVNNITGQRYFIVFMHKPKESLAITTPATSPKTWTNICYMQKCNITLLIYTLENPYIPIVIYNLQPFSKLTHHCSLQLYPTPILSSWPYFLSSWSVNLWGLYVVICHFPRVVFGCQPHFLDYMWVGLYTVMNHFVGEMCGDQPQSDGFMWYSVTFLAVKWLATSWSYVWWSVTFCWLYMVIFKEQVCGDQSSFAVYKWWSAMFWWLDMPTSHILKIISGN